MMSVAETSHLNTVSLRTNSLEYTDTVAERGNALGLDCNDEPCFGEFSELQVLNIEGSFEKEKQSSLPVAFDKVFLPKTYVIMALKRLERLGKHLKSKPVQCTVPRPSERPPDAQVSAAGTLFGTKAEEERTRAGNDNRLVIKCTQNFDHSSAAPKTVRESNKFRHEDATPCFDLVIIPSKLAAKPKTKKIANIVSDACKIEILL